MSRPTIIYGDAQVASRSFAGFSPDEPTAGYYRMRLRGGGMMVGVRIWHGAPTDPETGEEMDRSHRWQAAANGRPIDLDRVWPVCADDPIDEAEATYLSGLQAWGAGHGHPALADPCRRLDPLHSPLQF